MGLLAKLRIDGFIIAILAAVGVAAVLPATGRAEDVLDVVVVAAIALLFFLYGARMEPTEAIAGLRHWRLHLTILGFTFLLFPLIGLALRPIAPYLVGEALTVGILFLCVVPSTVQSSIAFTSIARGNVAGAIVSASLSNILGVFLTPLLVIALISTTGGVTISGMAVVDICLQILLPFILGQLSRPLTARFVMRRRNLLKYSDRGTIVLVVYAAFSKGMDEGIWSTVGIGDILVLVALSVVLVVGLLWLTGVVSNRLGFSRGDRIAIQFCGTKKSLATGLPMAAIIFSGGSVGIVVLPLMIFHQVQLMICSWLAARYARQDDASPRASATTSPGTS